MKPKKQLIKVLLLFVLISVISLKAQENENKSYEMVEITYILPKVGLEKEFEKGIKEHNATCHSEGPYEGHLDLILTGNEAGWYVWVMGACRFTNLNDIPEENHNQNWSKNISPYVQEYGRTEMWKLDSELSFSSKNTPPNYENIWFIDLKRGKTEAFINFMKKIKVAYQKMGNREYKVYFTQFNDNDGRDVAITWFFNHWSKYDKSNAAIKKSYESIYGKGSWKKAMDEWISITNFVQSQMWKIDLN